MHDCGRNLDGIPSDRACRKKNNDNRENRNDSKHGKYSVLNVFYCTHFEITGGPCNLIGFD